MQNKHNVKFTLNYVIREVINKVFISDKIAVGGS